MAARVAPGAARALAVRWLTGALVVGLLVAVGWWAGRVTLGPAAAERTEAESVTATVVRGSVGRSLDLNVTVTQPFVAVATNGLAGTVTSVTATEVEVAVGGVLYEVDTVPVRAVVGEVPFWRELAADAIGDDVRQLQQALTTLGHYSDEIDGRLTWPTVAAVRAWQQESGLPVTGVVRHGELVAVPQLPARLGLAEQIITGARLAGGEPAVFAATGEIDFRLVVSQSQAGLIPPAATVSIPHDQRVWAGTLGDSSAGEDGNIQFDLTGPDGGPVCGDDCASLPAVERTSLRAQVTIVPEVSGPTVPVAAVHTDPNGTAWVRLADGSRREVLVLGSAGGVAVVEGLSVGDQIQVLGGSSGDSEPSATAHSSADDQ